jgi:hypothetical protein
MCGTAQTLVALRLKPFGTTNPHNFEGDRLYISHAHGRRKNTWQEVWKSEEKKPGD